MPLALLAVGSAVDRSRFEVVVIDGRLESDTVRAVRDAARDALCVGMSVLTGAPIRDALMVARALRAENPQLPIIWGGWHPSLFPGGCLADPAIDVVVTGQGEDTFIEIVERLAAGTPLDGCAGLGFRRNGETLIASSRPLRDLNAFPAHDYSLIPVARYFALKGKRQLDYISSQGCRFRCAFCADPYVYKRGWVGLTPERIGREVEALLNHVSFTELAFQDETFFTQPARVEAICDQFLARRLPITWTATMRADQGVRMNERTFVKARAAGLTRVMIGVESGAQQMLDAMKKDMTVAHVLEVAERCVRHDIGAIFNFIVGFPDEPAESVRETMTLIKRLRSMRPDFETPLFYYRPYPGTEIADGRADYVFPTRLEDWADFDYVGARGPWVSDEKWKLIERFKFYARHAWGRRQLLRLPLRAAARWRCGRDEYRLPFEKGIVEFFRPSRAVS